MESKVRKAMQASRIPVLRERCPNLEVGGRKKLVGRVKAQVKREEGKWKEVRGCDEEGGNLIGDLKEELERTRRENRHLRTKLATRSKTRHSLMEAQCSPTHFLPGSGSEDEETVDLFVDNVILRSKQALEQERLQALMAAAPHLQSVATLANNWATSPTSSRVSPSTGCASPPVGAKPADVTLPVILGGNTGSCQQDASSTTNQPTVDELWHRMATLEATEVSRRQEVWSKEARIATPTRQMRDMTTKLESAASSHSEVHLYRQLYHQSVRRCSSLRHQVETFRQLFARMKSIQDLKDMVMECLAENKAILDQQQAQLQQQTVHWQQKLTESNARQASLEKECEGLREALAEQHCSLQRGCAQLLSKDAIGKAVNRMQEERVRDMEDSASRRETELTGLRKTMKKYKASLTVLKRSADERKECAEFSEAERATLQEENAELEVQTAGLRDTLREKQEALHAQEDALKAAGHRAHEAMEDRSHARKLLLTASKENGELRNATKLGCTVLKSVLEACKGISAGQDCVPPGTDADEEMGSGELCGHLRELCQRVEQTLPALEDSPSGQDPSPSKTPYSPSKTPTCSSRTSACPSCVQLQTEMDSVLASLNTRSTARYGDMLRQNLSLQEQVASLRRELNRGDEQYHKLTQYLQEYQSNSSEKVAVLKENLLKADREVAELDQLVEQVRQVLYANIGHVRACPPILELLKELDGTEAPQQY